MSCYDVACFFFQEWSKTMSTLLQKLQQAAAQQKQLPNNPVPNQTPFPVLVGGNAPSSKWNPIKAGCVCGFIVLLVIAVVLIINRLHEQSHNANLVRLHSESNEEDWKDLDVEDEARNNDPNFTQLKDLIGKA